MSILGKLFNKKPEIPEQEVEARRSSADPEHDPNLIRVFDDYGQELFITRDEWRKNVLPSAIRSKWNIPDQLYGIIVAALSDGFINDVLEAAQQLHRIDPIPARSACIYGIVLMKNKRLDEAERVLRSFLQKHGEDSAVLINLAKVYADRNEMQVAEDMLWHALEIDPNQANGFGWYEAIYRERFGEEGGLDALGRIAALPGSWRAQIWLARASLRSGDLEQALTFYHESLSRLGKNIPPDLLMQISGDLGKHGHLSELLQLAEPYFVAEDHGLQVGNNLIKAHLDLGHIEAARQIVEQLYSLKRPDWRDTLNYWDTEIAKARLATSRVELNETTKIAMLVVDGPVWLKPSSPAATLFPTPPQENPFVSFLAGTSEAAADSESAHPQLPNAPGSMSRALPLFLAEQVQFAYQANVQTLIPWIGEESGGFVLSGVAWNDKDAVEYSRQGELKSDYVVITHLKPWSEPWIVELRLVQTADGKCLGKLDSSLVASNPVASIHELARQLIALFVEQTNFKPQTAAAPFYQLPAADYFPSYLLRLEQLLALRCGAMDESSGFLIGEREIIDGNLQLCLACPQNVTTRILLTQTLLIMNKIRPEVVREFSDKIVLLQTEKPLREPAHSIIQAMLTEVISS